MKQQLRVPKKPPMKTSKKIWITILILFLVIVGCAGGYVVYMSVNYYRIADNTSLDVGNNQVNRIKSGQKYSVVTWNTGFGAYNQDFSFFMNSGEMKDGTKVTGKSSRAASSEVVEDDTNGDIKDLKVLNPDFTLLQEVDQDSTRSWHINMVQMFEDAFPDQANVFANNFHSAYLLYPFNEPHGSVQAGLLSLSKFKITDATRMSYPVDESFFIKFTDLDRCFSVNRIPVEGTDKQLVLINSHMSAYDKDGTIRTEQMKVLSDYIGSEYDKGNYVIIGGDFNQVLTGKKDSFSSDMNVPSWVADFDSSLLPDGFSVVDASNASKVPTVRSSDIPWQEGVTYTTIVDGFIVSGNVEATAENIDTDFAYSDHNPVQLTFSLK
ncbi:MAG: endonuclease/exonuclease/phosphatase family protein [Eubacteriaceae bacterium]